MKLFDKIKNVLFEEEEVEVPVKRVEEKRVEEKRPPVKREERVEIPPRVTEIKEKAPVVEDIPKKEAPVITKIEIEDEIDSDFIERDIFNPKKTFEFPVFDESDFEDTKNFTRGKNNILEKEKEAKKKVSFGKYDEIKVEDKKEDIVKNFKPSPVISPVYGILDQNYKKEDIKEKDFKTDSKKRALTVEAVRNKAYGTLEDEIESILPNKIEEKALEDLIKEEDEMEITSPKKTIDDLLLESVDETLTVGELEGMLEEENYDEEEIESKEEHMSKTMNVLDDIESEIEENSIKESIENDTLENDLFNLIDSMYDTREEE